MTNAISLTESTPIPGKTNNALGVSYETNGGWVAYSIVAQTKLEWSITIFTHRDQTATSIYPDGAGVFKWVANFDNTVTVSNYTHPGTVSMNVLDPSYYQCNMYGQPGRQGALFGAGCYRGWLPNMRYCVPVDSLGMCRYEPNVADYRSITVRKAYLKEHPEPTTYVTHEDNALFVFTRTFGIMEYLLNCQVSYTTLRESIHGGEEVDVKAVLIHDADAPKYPYACGFSNMIQWEPITKNVLIKTTGLWAAPVMISNPNIIWPTTNTTDDDKRVFMFRDYKIVSDLKDSIFTTYYTRVKMLTITKSLATAHGTEGACVSGWFPLPSYPYQIVCTRYLRLCKRNDKYWVKIEPTLFQISSDLATDIIRVRRPRSNFMNQLVIVSNIDTSKIIDVPGPDYSKFYTLTELVDMAEVYYMSTIPDFTPIAGTEYAHPGDG